MKISATVRERWALRVHLDTVRIETRTEGRRMDRLFDALKLDETSAISAASNPDDVPIDHGEYQLEADLVDAITAWLDGPMVGAMRRILRDFDRRLTGG